MKKKVIILLFVLMITMAVILYEGESNLPRPASAVANEEPNTFNNCTQENITVPYIGENISVIYCRNN